MVEGKFLWKNIVRRRNERISHIMRYEGLLKLNIKGSLEGKACKIIKYVQQMMKYQACNSCVEMKRIIEKNGI